MRVRALVVVIVPALAGMAGVAVAQSVAVDTVITRADSLYFASRVTESMGVCRHAIEAAGTAPLHECVARAYVAMGMMLPFDAPLKKELYDSALVHARAALALAPGEVHARYAVAVAAGRRAHRDDRILSIKLAYEVYEQVTAILAVDSLHAGAHHVLGALNGEVVRAPRVVRFIAGSILRIDIAKRASWEQAEEHERRAVALDPRMMTFAVDLADLYGRANRTAQRDSVLARMRAMEPLHPMDRFIRDACLARWEPQRP